ncbi:MATE family efflux transporter [Sedimentibacter sp. zth1]|uniref:MATE family efflux transporter n=1 Tax=Sedimentibacter sp. zth1 TaxID=2816908 RepID=UPI001A933E1C|nr:MATE family efflux transporter [Sedimentibacter sp. zth1]QSX06263.1 MATE family efflux transporter [Sedimentibacter sp. zth1]
MSDKKQFYRFVIPSIGSMLVTGLYFVVDGIFVGRGVGTNGLAAVNIAVPFISLLTAISMMITMGGATLTSISFGKGENKKANNYFNTSLLLVLLFSLGMTAISVLFPTQLVKFLGASNMLIESTATYLKYYVIFGIFLCGSSTLSAFVRNDGNPQLAFWGMIIGAISNVFFDWLFIFPLQMGIKGAAIASGLGQILACIVLSAHFMCRKGVLKIETIAREKGIITQIIKAGIPEFVTQMSQPVTILCYNNIVLNTFGEIGVSAFSVISYIIVVILAVFIGLAQGIQPLLSRSIGEGNREKENFFFQKGLQFNILLSCIIYLIMLIFGKAIISIFNNDAELIKTAYNCIIIYGISFIFASVNIVYTTYNLATKNTKVAMMIAVLRSFICNSIFIFLMPALFGINMVWTGMIVAELVVMIIAITQNKKSKEASLI